jgi:predicted lipoprotein with Yx(FWY)xxD motif
VRVLTERQTFLELSLRLHAGRERSTEDGASAVLPSSHAAVAPPVSVHNERREENIMRSLTIMALAIVALTLGAPAVAQTPPAAAMPAAVHAMGGVLMDAKGMSLYTYDNDKELNKSACVGGCLTNWPALKAEAADKDLGDWKVITRDDGAKQWAYKGKPLYYFLQDKAMGDKVGDGRGGVWHLAKP